MARATAAAHSCWDVTSSSVKTASPPDPRMSSASELPSSSSTSSYHHRCALGGEASGHGCAYAPGPAGYQGCFFLQASCQRPVLDSVYIIGYPAMMPPSMTSSEPVMKDDSSEARNRTALAISSGSPSLPMGTRFLIASTFSGSSRISWMRGGVHGSGVDRVGPDAQLCVLDSRGLGEEAHGGLGRTVRRRVRGRDDAVGRGEVDYRPVAVSAHLVQHRLCAQEYALGVDLHGQVPVFGRLVLYQVAPDEAGVVDQDVELAVAPGGETDGVGPRGCGCDVEDGEDGPATRLLDLAGYVPDPPPAAHRRSPATRPRRRSVGRWLRLCPGPPPDMRATLPASLMWSVGGGLSGGG